MFEEIERILSCYRHRVDHIEVRAETIRTVQFAMSDGEIRALDDSEETGYSIRCCHKGGWGFVSLNRPENLDSMAERCIDIARRLGRDRTELAPVDPVRAKVEVELIEDPRNVPLQNKIDLFREYTDRSKAVSDQIRSVKGKYFEVWREIGFLNSDGTCLHLSKLDMGGALTPYAHRDDLTQFLTVTTGSSDDFGVFRAMGARIEETSRRTVELLDAPKVRAGRYPVIADPVLGGIFAHEAFGHMSEADEYQTNPDMKDIFIIGKRFGADDLSIYDTGLDVGTRGYLPYDDEGVPGRRTDLIRNGILVGRLHSRESAARFDEAPTGSARTTAYRFPPICRMRNTCIDRGTASFDELLDGVDLGVYAIDSHGGTGGEMFSFDAGYGYMIRNGRLAELVRDVRLSGNLFKTLNDIDKVGSDFRIVDDAGGCGKGAQYPLETTCSSPHLRMQGIVVGGA